MHSTNSCIPVLLLLKMIAGPDAEIVLIVLLWRGKLIIRFFECMFQVNLLLQLCVSEFMCI